jgi:hypothetical protein
MSGELGSDATTARKLWREDTDQQEEARIYQGAGVRFDLLAGLVAGLIATRPALHGHPARALDTNFVETRAVNRALRKAYGIGICSIEEIGSLPARSQPEANVRKLPPQPANGNGEPKLRDQLCLLIRQHRLDAALVKQFPAEFCGTKDLRQASREQVATFIKHIAEFAARDREELVVSLNSFARQAGAA